MGLQIDFWISEISTIYFFILFYFFAIGLIFGCMLIVVAVKVSFGLWWRQPILIVGVVVASWTYLWWLWVKRERERERERESSILLYSSYFILLGCM